MLGDIMDVEKPQSVSLFSSFGIVRLFSKKNPLQFFDVLHQRMLKKSKRVPLLARQFGLTFGFSGTVKEYLTL